MVGMFIVLVLPQEEMKAATSNYSYGKGIRLGEPTFKIEFKFINHIGQSFTISAS
jgi:hypothetical protein